MIELASRSTVALDWVGLEPLDAADDALVALLPHALNNPPASNNKAAIAPATGLELI
jgi:hypothetical protein